MNIQAITKNEIEKLAQGISVSVVEQLNQFAADKEEAALLAEIRTSNKPKKVQVMEYLQRTARRFTKNQYLAKNLYIDTYTLKEIRLALEAENKVSVLMIDGVIHLYKRTVQTT